MNEAVSRDVRAAYLNAPAALTAMMQLAEATIEQRVVVDQNLILKEQGKL